MAESRALTVPTVEVTDSDEKTLVQEQNSQMLADALARMDGLIGDFRYVAATDRPCQCLYTVLVNNILCVKYRPDNSTV